MFLAHTVALQKASKGHCGVGMGLKKSPGMTHICSSPLSVQQGFQACEGSWSLGCSTAQSKIMVLGSSYSGPSVGPSVTPFCRQ